MMLPEDLVKDVNGDDEALQEALYKLRDEEARPRHQILGRPLAIQNDDRERECQLAWEILNAIAVPDEVIKEWLIRQCC